MTIWFISTDWNKELKRRLLKVKLLILLSRFYTPVLIQNPLIPSLNTIQPKVYGLKMLLLLVSALQVPMLI